ncbi:MAG: hypothetical protein J5711_00240 [Bacteroidales bacterium]|nr:hypothetical protein [Bacteroidales bacterium]
MKRLLLVIAALAMGGMLYAQSDSVSIGDQQVTDSNQLTATPTVDTASSRVIADSVPMEPVRKLSRRQQMRYFGHDFSSWFVEVKYLYGTYDMAIGLNLSYVPNIVGFYGTFMNGVNAYWGSAGVVYRFSRIDSRVDCQAYAGFVAGFGYGAEVGMRLARVNRRHKAFSWMSVSVGATLTNYGSFFSCGLSLPFGVPAAAVSLF